MNWWIWYQCAVFKLGQWVQPLPRVFSLFSVRCDVTVTSSARAPSLWFCDKRPSRRKNWVRSCSQGYRGNGISGSQRGSRLPLRHAGKCSQLWAAPLHCLVHFRAATIRQWIDGQNELSAVWSLSDFDAFLCPHDNKVNHVTMWRHVSLSSDGLLIKPWMEKIDWSITNRLISCSSRTCWYVT